MTPVFRDLRIIIVAVFALFTGAAGIWSLPPLDRDEARFAQATAQMLESGDFIAIRFQEDERNKKPAGIHWLQAASVSALSAESERQIWAYRIPSLIGAVFAAVFTYLAALRLYDARTALVAALLLASAPVVAAESTIAKTDGMLLGLVCLAQLAFIHIYARAEESQRKTWRWPLLFWGAHGAAALIKGPIAPMVSLLTGAGLFAAKRNMRWLQAMRPVSGFFILALITAPWVIAIGLATEGRFFTDAIGGDMLGKVGGAQEGHYGPPGYHSVLLWLLFWPASALIIPGLLVAWRERDDWRSRFLLAWIIPAWIVFEIAATKLPHYTMPLYPALAILAARVATGPGVKIQWAARVGAAVYIAVGLTAAGLLAALPVYFSAAPLQLACFAIASLVALGTVLIGALFWRGRRYAGALSAAGLAALYAWIVMTTVLPGLSSLAVSPRLSTALEIAGRHPLHDDAPPTALVGYNEPSAVFLLGTQTALTNASHAAALLNSGAAGAAIIEQRHEAAFQNALSGAGALPLAVIDGLNYSNGDEVSLTIYVLRPPEPAEQ
ncbi:ArnT family glycosyltransferase [Hyphococcus sp.]|uniref:ArnT family glycosyltransferase n=1 Tax=Hyphococcus sp. TaxID=2038636 RepID=UPI003CCC0E50